MTTPGRTFAVTSDDALLGFISSARHRLVVVAPALTQAVADALSRRFDDLEQLDLTVILDSDPERLTENELSDFSRLWHDGCGKAISKAQDVDRNHSSEV